MGFIVDQSIEITYRKRMLVLLMMFFSSLIQLFTLTNYDNSAHESYVDWITNHSHPQDITLKCTHGKELMSTKTHPIFYLIFFVRVELTRLIHAFQA